jgi:RND family efflux transporter MFP subunit
MNLKMICISIFFAAAVASCGPKEEADKNENKFPVSTPTLADTSQVSEYVAKIFSIQYVEIHAKINGYLEKIFIDEGQAVKEGQVLFQINSQEYKRELDEAKANVKNMQAEAKEAELALRNTKHLADIDIVSNTELEIAVSKLEAMKAKVEEAKARQSRAELNVSLTEIKAPFSGIINRIPYKIGSLINEGTLLTTLSNNQDVYAYFHVSEIEYLNFKSQGNNSEENEIILLLANNEPHKYKGKIETIEVEFDEKTGNIAFRARFPNPDLLLKHGSSGKVQLINKIENALLIPQESTFEIQEYTYVYTVDENDQVKMQRVVPKMRLGLSYVLESGLKRSDLIVTQGIQLLKDGDKITPVNNLEYSTQNVSKL